MNKPLAIVLMGAPGAGKSTQAQMLQARYDLAVLSTGQIVRNEISKGSALGRRAVPAFLRGLLLPDDLMIAVIRGALQELPAGRSFLLDGFPRTTLQAEALDAMLQELQRPLSAVQLPRRPRRSHLRRSLGARLRARRGAHR